MPITDSLAAALRAHLARTAERGVPGDYMFASRSGRPLGQRNVARELRRAQTVAKRPDGSLVLPVCTNAMSGTSRSGSPAGRFRAA